jgi:MATE family multidrug resistance protein
MDSSVRARVRDTWRRVFDLSWPMMVEQVTRTGMRTTDVLVTGLFSPAAIAAVGLADLYARFPLRIGLGLGGGAIALSSQDSGADADANRDEAVTQAVLLGLVAGLPFVLFGLLFGEAAIGLLGAPERVAREGGTYLAVVFATAPFRHVSLVAARSLQGTGDTRTPMAVNVVANGLNIAGSLVLGLGLLGAPRLAILGVGLATAGGNVFSATVLSLALASDHAEASFVRPRNATIARQLVRISVPRLGEGLVATLAEFPFNALLLSFGTDVNAAYQVGRRAYQQVTGPLSRGYNVAASVVVGQALGEGARTGGDASDARFQGWATAALGALTVGGVGLLLVAAAPWVVRLFTDDPGTVRYGVGFTRTYGVGAVFLVTFVVLSGALQGGSDTRTPFVARTTGLLGFYLGASYLFGVVLDWGVTGAYVGILGYYAWAALVVVYGFQRGDWAARATDMMAQRGSAGDD